jgi:glycosyltransferase involved in cell wall biosynthesis
MNGVNQAIVDQLTERDVVSPCRRSGSPSVLMVDASCFSLPYDYSLCDALAGRGCAVTLLRSEFVHTPWSATSFLARNYFYQRSHAASGSRGVLWKLGKLAEHNRDMGRLVAECEAQRPDIIHFQWLPVPLIDRRYLSRLGRVAPLFLTLHNTASFHGSLVQRLHQETGLSSVFQYLSGLIVHTEYSKRVVIERGWVSAEKIHVVPHGVLDYYRSASSSVMTASASAAAPSGEPTILFFGQIEHYKGIDLLLRAFAGLPPAIQRANRICIAGKPGMDANVLKKLASSLKIERQITWMLRFINEEEVPGLFASAAVVALPYREIDQSGVLMTAIAFAKPIIASRIGGLAETIEDHRHGRLFPAGDVPALTAVLEDMLGHPGRRGAMEIAVGALRETLSWEKSAYRTIDVYQEVLPS